MYTQSARAEIVERPWLQILDTCRDAVVADQCDQLVAGQPDLDTQGLPFGEMVACWITFMQASLTASTQAAIVSSSQPAPRQAWRTAARISVSAEV